MTDALNTVSHASFGRNDTLSDLARLRFYDAGAVPELLSVLRFVSGGSRPGMRALEAACQALTNIGFNKVAQVSIARPTHGAIQLLLARATADIDNAE